MSLPKFNVYVKVLGTMDGFVVVKAKNQEQALIVARDRIYKKRISPKNVYCTSEYKDQSLSITGETSVWHNPDCKNWVARVWCGDKMVKAWAIKYRTEKDANIAARNSKRMLPYKTPEFELEVISESGLCILYKEKSCH